MDDAPIKGMTDANYLVSTLKQQVLASGGILKEPKDQADYILEVRAGALGTDRHERPFRHSRHHDPDRRDRAGIPSQIPEIPFVKKTDQRAVTKIALFLYNRQTGRPVWQSGAAPEESRAKAWWVLGAGPFQRGTIYGGTKFAGDRLTIPLVDPVRNPEGARVAVNDAAFFVEPKEEPRPPQKPPTVANKRDGASAPKDQAVGASGAAAGPSGAAAASAPPPANGTTPPGAGPPGVVAASHTTADKPPGNAPSLGPLLSSPPAAWAPPAPLPPGDAGDRVLPLPPVSPFDE